jgi:uncharacterized protein
MERFYNLFNLSRGVSVAKRVRVAATSSERRKGLLGIAEMDREAGLWIMPCEAVHTFGMKMPLDLVFLDRSYRVRKIRRGIGPNRISLCLSASSVVELSAGALSESGTQVNDTLTWKRVG